MKRCARSYLSVLRFGAASLPLLLWGCEGAASDGDDAAVGSEQAVLTLAPDVPAPITRDRPTRVVVNLETQELVRRLADGVEYTFWTFGGGSLADSSAGSLFHMTWPVPTPTPAPITIPIRTDFIFSDMLRSLPSLDCPPLGSRSVPTCHRARKPETPPTDSELPGIPPRGAIFDGCRMCSS